MLVPLGDCDTLAVTVPDGDCVNEGLCVELGVTVPLPVWVCEADCVSLRLCVCEGVGEGDAVAV